MHRIALKPQTIEMSFHRQQKVIGLLIACGPVFLGPSVPVASAFQTGFEPGAVELKLPSLRQCVISLLDKCLPSFATSCLTFVKLSSSLGGLIPNSQATGRYLSLGKYQWDDISACQLLSNLHHSV